MFANQNLFITYAIIAGLLSSISFGIIGSIIVAKRITYITGAISHIILGGIGLGLFINYHYNQSWLTPTMGALIISIFAALIINYLKDYRLQREDSIISSMWAIGMSVGLILISKVPGYIDLNSYLFGNILLVSLQDIYLLIIWDIVLIFITILFYYKILAISFDEEFSKSINIKVSVYNCSFLIISAISTVLLIKIVGIILCIALFVIPATAASFLIKKLWQMIILSIIFSLIFILIGFALSYHYDLPAGATIVISGGSIYLILILIIQILKMIRMKET